MGNLAGLMHLSLRVVDEKLRPVGLSFLAGLHCAVDGVFSHKLGSLWTE